MKRSPTRLSFACLLVAGAFPGTAFAQPMDIGNAGGGAMGSAGADAAGGDAPAGGDLYTPRKPGAGKQTVFIPYVEVSQVVTSRHSPNNDTLTYSRVAAGLDASVAGRNTGGSVSLRYERRFSWDNHGDGKGDTISGLASGYVAVAPGVQIQAGGLATRERIGVDGASIAGPLGNLDTITQVYSVYAGPSVTTRVGDVGIKADYRFGYTKIEQPHARINPVSGQATDIFNHSTVHNASVEAGVKPGDVLPVGLAAGGSYYREDVSNLDQRVEDKQARATVTVPVSQNVQVSGALGYEKMRISGRDAMRDGNGLPVVDGNGNYVTDPTSPRVIAYDVDGLIWDVGVMWRPSRRTSLTAHVGRRYGSTTYTGSFSYAPNERSSLNIAVYDGVAGFGGNLTQSLANLPTSFDAVRNPFTGDLNTCVSSTQQGACLGGALGSVRSSVFRSRGVVANYSVRLGHITAGVGGGYDRRKFIGAPGTVLALANGVVDENYWATVFVNAQLDRVSTISADAYANWISSGGAGGGNTRAWGGTAAYYRNLSRHLRATAALGIEGLSQAGVPYDYWTASALVGVRYSF